MTTYQRDRVIERLSQRVASTITPIHPEKWSAWCPPDYDVDEAMGLAQALCIVEIIHDARAPDCRASVAVEMVAWAWYLGRLGGHIPSPERT